MITTEWNLEYRYFEGDNEYYIGKHRVPDRIMPFCVAVNVIEGEYFVEFADGRIVSISPGETIFIPSFVKHTVEMKERGKLNHIHFLCSYVNVDLFSFLERDYFVTDAPEIPEGMKKLNDTVYDNAVAQKIYRDKLLCDFLLFLFREKIMDIRNLVVDPWLHPILQYIRTNLREGVTVEEVIAASGWSKTLFYQRFREKMKVRPHEYIEAERFKEAGLLLLAGRKVKEVAEIMGFHDTSYFNKVFKQKFGMTPMEYKQNLNYKEGEKL